MVFFRIEHIRRETKDTLSYVLKPIQNELFVYKAGQFLTFLFNFPNGIVRRSYSFSSSPLFDPWPVVTIKVVPNGEISRYIHEYWKVGDVVESLPPAGMFVLESSEQSHDIFLLAAGSGITPVYSLLNELLNSKFQYRIHLYYSNRSKEDTIFLDQIERLRSLYPEKLNVEFFFSDSKYLEQARLSKYLLIDLIERDTYFSKEQAVFFMCGPFEYMQMIGIALNAISISKDQIRREIFVTNDIEPPRFEVSDKRSKSVQLYINGNIYNLLVPYQLSILDAGLANKIPLPYSCHAGKCSACVARCIQGEVEMAYNEVLTNRDEERGLILTCTGHPVSDDVIIKYEN